MDWTGILIGTGVGALALFVWNALAWMALHHHDGDFRSAKDAEGLDEALTKLEPTDAYYGLPHIGDYVQGMKDPELEARMQRGPNALIYRWPPGPCMKGSTFAYGFCINLVDAFGCALLVGLFAADLGGLVGTVGVCLALGLFVALTANGGMANWSMMPKRFALTNSFDRLVGYLLVGIALHFVGPGVPGAS